MKVAILGVTGYTGQILLRLLADHPSVDTILPASSSKGGTALAEFDPGLSDQVLLKTEPCREIILKPEEVKPFKPDVLFSPLPHLASAENCRPFLGTSVIIDLSADLRLSDREQFLKAYGEEPPCPDLLPKAVYGLSEIYKKEIAQADLIANPGCYPTATLLPLIPLLKRGYLQGKVVVNALSGISGAGKKAVENLLFCERTENAGAYSPGKSHRHVTEIESQMNRFSSNLNLLFTPHLIPVKRGMVVTTQVSLRKGIHSSEICAAFKEDYKDSPFVKVHEKSIPQIKDVWGSNRCDLGYRAEGEELLLFSVIDNLVKGASGQAVQNMNIRFGLSETAGLRTFGEL